MSGHLTAHDVAAALRPPLPLTTGSFAISVIKEQHVPGPAPSINKSVRQLPIGDEIFLDHIGHFVADAEAAGAALHRAGFAPTPVSVQVNPDGTRTGTGNITAMFSHGYMEVLFKTADTPLGQEFQAALTGHAGVHLAALSVADAEATHKRLEDAGFPMRPLVRFQRPVDTETGAGIAAFTVVRPERGAMAEGRIQLLTHRTEDTVWQPRWLRHPNGARGLADLVIVSADVAEAAARFERFTARPAVPARFGHSIPLDRGRIEIMTEAGFAALVPETPPPRLPFLGAYAIEVASLGAAEAVLARAGLGPRRAGKALAVAFPPELGTGSWLFAEQASDLPWRAR
ncbi:MAG TPA: VOC family protein [Hyphomicrobiaceae bacterium]|nr:VOC family protein [Hyphomicrobiaceae bacterium]